MALNVHLAGLARAATVALLATGCASLPSLEGRPASRPLSNLVDTPLEVASRSLAKAHPGQTGVYALSVPTDAFAARALLAKAAQRSLDAQYYIWRADETGLLLLRALRDAARRGVRVRVLLDDQDTRAIEDTLAALQTEPNLEIRLYNPFPRRGGRSLAYLTDFSRLNHRMHNKVFLADGHVAIIGGRNIGNEYFGAGSAVPFRDLDVLAIGDAVREANEEFELYWNSPSAYPSTQLLPAAGPDDVRRADELMAGMAASETARVYLEALRDAPLVAQLLAHRLMLDWASARLVRDDPAKTLASEPRPEDLALTQMIDLAGPARHSLDIVSPYFVPAEKGTATLTRLARSGIRVRILTNSLSSTDVSVVHSGYAKRRCELARAGVLLFELKPDAIEELAKARSKLAGSSGSASLHAKTFAVDGARVFVGSFNFDPRSALLNTEMGLIIESPVLAARFTETFDRLLPGLTYAVQPLEGADCIAWIDSSGPSPVRHETEPGVSALRRAWLGVLMALPLDWML